MRMYLDKNVFDASLDRVRWLFSEFDHVVVSVSGGKDSTICYQLAMKVAEELGRLPLEVMFIDQEAEWDSVIRYMRTIMNDPRVRPYWLQMPLKIFNSSSTEADWLYCWEEGREDRWIREKEPNSIKVNRYSTIRFKEIFSSFMAVEFEGRSACSIGGLRAEENPGRLLSLTGSDVYKGATWAKAHKHKGKPSGKYVFYPIYDWSYLDVWKAIHDNGWPYCSVYDSMYQRGIAIQDMRVSNVHHETALKVLTYMQEIEPDTWNRISARLAGVNTVKQLEDDFKSVPKVLPRAFKSWTEYRDYLLDNLMVEEHRDTMRKWFSADMVQFKPEFHGSVVKMHIATILVNDYHGTKRTNFKASHPHWLKKFRRVEAA